MLLAETSELLRTVGASELLELATASETPKLAEVSASLELAEVSTSPELVAASSKVEGKPSPCAPLVYNCGIEPYKTLPGGPYDHTSHKSSCSCEAHVPLDHNHGTPLARETDSVLAAADRKAGTLASLNYLHHLVLDSSVHPSWIL